MNDVLVAPPPPATSGIESPLRHLDVASVSAAAAREVARREKQLPIVSVFRWWARRTSAVSGAILDAVAKDLGSPLRIADPFAGGGTVAFEALLRGHSIHAQDIDPWAAHGIAAAIGLPSPQALRAAGERLHNSVADLLDRAYSTTFADGAPATITHTFRVAVGTCPHCGTKARLFPYATLSRFRRVGPDDRAWLACRRGHVHDGRIHQVSHCPQCDEPVDPAQSYSKGRQITCCDCGATATLAAWSEGGFRWEPILVERSDPLRREIDKPSNEELICAESDWAPARQLSAIAEGQETAVLLRHGFNYWHELYPARQRVVLESILDAVPGAADGDTSLEGVLRIIVAGAAEMAGHLSRWDRRYLKSYEAMAGHRFNLTTLAAEPNVWGIGRRGRGSVRLRLAAAQRAAAWLASSRKAISVVGPLAGQQEASVRSADAVVVHGSSEHMPLVDGSIDLIWTDPPYHDDLQYHDLSAPFRGWIGLAAVDPEASAVASGSTDTRYTEVLRSIFTECRRILAPHGRLLVTFANRETIAWIALFDALREAGFQACGYEVVRSDAENDHAKRGGRACTMDLILDLVPTESTSEFQIHRSRSSEKGEAVFLVVTGELALEAISSSPGADWRERLRTEQNKRLLW
jgi:putative DNA methylase